MTTDWKALCAELLEALDGWHKAVFETGTGWVRPDETYLIDRARAALAEQLNGTDPIRGVPPLLAALAALAADPVADGPAVQSREPASVATQPSDEELLDIAAQAIDGYSSGIKLGEYEAENEIAVEAYGSELITFARAVLARYGHQPAPPAEGEVEGPTDEGVEVWADQQGFVRGHADHPCGFWIDDGDVGALVRAALSRWGHQPAPVAEGEVGELVAWLRLTGEGQPRLSDEGYARLTRVADLLSQRHPTPVPVSERLPGPEDCDEEGLCWWFSPADPSAGTFGVAACWVLRKHEPEDDFRTHWLSATALPLPQGEVQP